jgi:hypothetical protein
MSWSELRAWLFIFALFFVFSGEPDLWDHLHDLAMNAGCVR